MPGRLEAQPSNRSQNVVGCDEVSSSTDDQGAVDLAAKARKLCVGLGAQLRRPIAAIGQIEFEHVSREAMTPDKRQTLGRRALGDFEAGARLGAEKPRDGVAFGDA
jgi:hypothetical protein